MQILWQIGIIMGICLLGEGISLLLPLSFPASVLAMVILFLILMSKKLTTGQLRETNDFMKQYMSFLFVPSGVGIMQIFGDIRGSLIAILAICILSTIATFAVTAWTVRGAMKLQDWVRARREGKV